MHLVLFGLQCSILTGNVTHVISSLEPAAQFDFTEK